VGRRAVTGDLDSESPPCFNENMSETATQFKHEIIDRQDVGQMTIITIEQYPEGLLRQVWTLIASADGTDTLVAPNGDIIRVEGDLVDPRLARANAVLAWLVDNL
jgi:hypothetical protein